MKVIERLGQEREARLRKALKKIGPQRCKNALRAWRENGNGWDSCPVAFAVGDRGQLSEEAGRTGRDESVIAAERLGVPIEAIGDIISAYDSAYTRMDLKGYFALEALRA